MKLKLTQFLIFLFFIGKISFSLNAQIGVNTTGAAPANSAMLDIASPNKGLLIPRMNTVAREAITSPAEGLAVFDTDEKDFYFYNGTKWMKMHANYSASFTNVGLGENALYLNTKSSQNVAIGYNAMSLNNTVAIGTDGANTAIGFEALKVNQPTDNTDGKFNTAVGNQVMLSNTTGGYNDAFGSRALKSNTIGSLNMAIGGVALEDNIDGNNNVAIGRWALNNNVGNHGSMAVGYFALRNADNRAVGVFTNNTAIGLSAMQGSTTPANNTGLNNTALGHSAMYSFTSGGNNVALGKHVLYNNAAGNFNTGLGNFALKNNIGNHRSTALGYGAMENADNRSAGQDTFNTAVGVFALKGSANSANNTGQNNVAVGDLALGGNTSGSGNTAIGKDAMLANTTGLNNTIIGYQAGLSNTTGDGNVFIGYSAASTSTTGDNNLVISNSNTGQPLIRGIFSANKLGVNILFADLNANVANFQVNGTASNTAGGNWLVNSDRRLKKNIADLNSQEILGKVLKMKGVNYEWNDENSGKVRPTGIQYGFIAQELQELFPTKVSADAKGILSATYGDFDPMLVEAIKGLKQLIDEQKLMIEAQQKRIENLENNALTSNKSEKLIK